MISSALIFISLTYGPRELSEVIGLEDEAVQLPESANLVRNGLKIVLLEVKDPQFTELANTCKENCVTSRHNSVSS